MHRRTIAAATAVLALAALAGPAATVLAGPPPAAKCEATKLKVAAGYAACRLKAEAKAVLKDRAPDHGKCDAAFAKKLGKAEEKAGPGVCPSEGDRGAITTVVADSTAALAGLLAGPDGCSHADQDRRLDHVIDDLFAAIAARDWTAVACHYHPDAFVIDDQGVQVGRAEITLVLETYADLFDAPFDIWQKDFYERTARVLFRLDGGWIEIEDGVFTFAIEAGRIRSQTMHGLITFNGPPPD